MFLNWGNKLDVSAMGTSESREVMMIKKLYKA